MDFPQELNIEPEVQITEEENTESNETQHELQNNYNTSGSEFQAYSPYYTKCGEILVKNGEFLINCCICQEHFVNFHYFSMHYNEFHEMYETSAQMVHNNSSSLTSSNQQLSGKLEQSFSEISLNHFSSNTTSQKRVFKDDDVEVIEIGECKFTVKKISSHEDISKLNNHHQNLDDIQQTTGENRNLKDHTNSYHDRDRPFECELCGKRFRQRESLNEHILSIHQKILPHKCDICDRGFFKASALQIHLRDHTGERPFVCETCQKSFKSKGALNEHNFIHTGIKRYACQFCSKEFLHSSSLRKHERIHTGETPYICEKCQSSFRTLDLLKEHMRLHDGEKGFKCRLCTAEFTHRMQLTGHYRVHSGSGLDPKKKKRRPCKCEICDKVLSRKSNLRTHLRNTHRLLESQVEELMRKLDQQQRGNVSIPEFDISNNYKHNELDILSTIC